MKNFILSLLLLSGVASAQSGNKYCGAYIPPPVDVACDNDCELLAVEWFEGYIETVMQSSCITYDLAHAWWWSRIEALQVLPPTPKRNKILQVLLVTWQNFEECLWVLTERFVDAGEVLFFEALEGCDA